MNRLRWSLAIVVLLTAIVSCFADETPSDNPRIKVHKRFVTLSEIDTGGKVHVKGVPGAIESTSPYTLTLSNLTTKEKINLQPNSNGSFDGAIAAGPGQKIRVLARNQEKKQSYGTFTVEGKTPPSPEPASSSAPPLSPDEIRKTLMERLNINEQSAISATIQFTKTENSDDKTVKHLTFSMQNNPILKGTLYLPNNSRKNQALVVCITNAIFKDKPHFIQRKKQNQYVFDNILNGCIQRNWICFVPESTEYTTTPVSLIQSINALMNTAETASDHIAAIGWESGISIEIQLAALDTRINAVVFEDHGPSGPERRLWTDGDAARDYLEKIPDLNSSACPAELNGNLYLMAIAPRPVLFTERLLTPSSIGQSELIRLMTDYYQHLNGPDPNYTPPVSLYVYSPGDNTDAGTITLAWLETHLKEYHP